MSGGDALRGRLLNALDADWERDPFISTHKHILDAILAEIAAAGYVIVSRGVLGRVGQALWGLMEDECWTDELVGLEPGDRAAIPGALTGEIDPIVPVEGE